MAHFYIMHSHAPACCLYTSSKTQSLNWKPHRIQSFFPVFIARTDNQKPTVLLSSNSTQQMAVKHMP